MSLPPRLKNVLVKGLALLPDQLQRFVVRLYLRHFPAILHKRACFLTLNSYTRWINRYDSLTAQDHEQIRADIENFRHRPLISVVISVFNPPEPSLRATLDSVIGQLYQNWELCLADDASTAPHVSRVLAEYAQRDRRIKIVFCPTEGGVSAACNSAIEIATGEFLAFLGHVDVLSTHALYLIAREIDQHPTVDLVYSDEDKITARGRRYDPHFKSDWNPDLFLSQNIISPLGVFRAELVDKVGKLRPEFDGSQDYDLALRVVDETSAERIRHIPYVLYHRRTALTSNARHSGERSSAVRARNAVRDHLHRRRIDAEVVSIPGLSCQAVQYPLDTERSVSIIIPTKDRSDLLSRCVRGILEQTAYRNLEVVIIDNHSDQDATHAYLRQIAGNQRVRILRYNLPFNFSLINNWGAEQSQGDILLFLNNDTEPIEASWLRHMVANACRPEVGAVGAKLLYPNGRVQHGGVILGMTGIAGHFHRNRPADDPGYFGRALLQQNLSAVTAACIAMRRNVFFEIGGFDGANLPIAFNDVDLCLRLRELGYLIVWTPLAQLIHHETASRKLDLMPCRYREFLRENDYMRLRWGHILDRDPYFSPNLSRHDLSPSLAFPPAVRAPWRVGAHDLSEELTIGSSGRETS
jgi:GT2 family glycosyltransferase